MSQYFDRNPDELAEGCIVTGLHEDGVVFPEIEPLGPNLTFIGRTALIEAVGHLLGITPDEVTDLVNSRARIQELEAQLTEANRVRDSYRALMAQLHRTFTETDVPVGELDERPAPKPRARRSKPKTPPAAPADLE